LQRAAVPRAEGEGDDRGRRQAGVEGSECGKAVRPRPPLRDPDRVPRAVAPGRVPQPQGDRADRRAHARLPRRRLVDGVVAVLLAKPRPFRQGVLSNLGNPKMAVFFSSLLPQFAHSFSGLLVLGLVFATMTLTWLSAYAFAVAKAGDVLRRPGVRRVIDAIV